MTDQVLLEKAKSLLIGNVYLTLGTINADGSPWTTPLYFAYDDELCLYWVSPKNAQHSENIRKNPLASLVVFDSHAPKWTGVGLYMTASVNELVDEAEALKGLSLEFARLQDPLPDIAGFVSEGAYRVYRATITQLWVTHDIEVDGKTIDARVPVELPDLVTFLMQNK